MAKTDEHAEKPMSHGFVVCRAAHADPKWHAPHCECGESHTDQGFTIPERIFTVGGEEGSFFLKRGGFAQVEYVRADLLLAVARDQRERDAVIVHQSGRIPKYDQFDNFHPSGEDIDPLFAQGWNAAIVSLEAAIRASTIEGETK